MTTGSSPTARDDTTAAKTLIVVCHPKPESLIRSGLERVQAGLRTSGAEVRTLDLDQEGFDPILTKAEHIGHLGTPSERPELAHHFELLQWCERLILVYPTWNSGQPARLKGWFDRVWMHDVAFVLPEGTDRIRGLLHNIRRIDVVTSHGSSRWVNFAQGNVGRIRINRNLRVLCHRFCRVHWHSIYGVDNATPTQRADWLKDLERSFAR